MNGDIAGCSDGTAIVFDAQRGITAAEAAVMLSNFLDPSPAAALESAYIPDWACTAVSSLTSCGVYPDGSDCAASPSRALRQRRCCWARIRCCKSDKKQTVSKHGNGPCLYASFKIASSSAGASSGNGRTGAGFASCAPMHFSIQTMEYHVPNL